MDAEKVLVIAKVKRYLSGLNKHGILFSENWLTNRKVKYQEFTSTLEVDLDELLT